MSEVSVTEYKFVVSHVMPPTLKPDMMNFCCLLTFLWDRDSSVGIVTPYGLEGLGIDSWWGRDFLHLPDWPWGPTQPPIQWVLGLFCRGKVAGAWRTTHPYLSPRLKKE